MREEANNVSYAERYIDLVAGKLNDLAHSQMERIGEGARAMAATMMANRLIHVFGTGHSHMLAEEMFYRAGGLVQVNPILDDGLMLHRDAVSSTDLERLEGYAAVLFHRQPVDAKDTAIIVSNSGRNAVVVEMAALFREAGATVIAITSLTHSRKVASRHSSGKKLYDVADIVIDNMSHYGDAALQIDGTAIVTGPTSTVVGAAIVNMLAAEAIGLCVEAGVEPAVFASSNTDDGDERNRRWIKAYRGVIAGL